MQLIEDLWRWTTAVVHWILEAWRVWAPAMVVVLTFIVAALVPMDMAELALRCSGFGYELLGILTVVAGLRDKRRLFDRPSLPESVRRWLERRPRWRARRQIISAVGTGSISMSGTARASMWRGAPVDAPIEARLAVLEANLATLRSEQEEIGSELQEATRKANETVDVERRARESAVADLRVQLEGLGAGGLNLEMMGVLLLVVGVVLTTIPGEIAAVLNRLR